MAEKDLPSNSDESDEDFVPEANGSSEEVSTSGPSEGESDHEKGEKSRKRRKVTRKKVKKCDGDKVDEETEVKAEVATDVDALWADFKEDVGKMEKQIVSSQKKSDDKQNDSESEKKPVKSMNENTKLISDSKRKIPPIPGSMNSGSKLGLNKILGQLGKKEKMSTLAKSKMDWNNFKKSEGIEEDIKTHNRGKDGYLEKQDFLQRTDLRQFEIEKQLRTSKRHF